jgi:hypothetical protein
VVIAAVVLMAAAPVCRASAQSPDSQVHLLDVPYLPQTESLCGGAAIAMLMRYWGATNVYAETFTDLVDPTVDGIHGADLLKALRSRGWDAMSFRGAANAVKANLAARRPVVALIQDRPGRLHYVVIVGWVEGHVIAHDPARAPFRLLDEKAFEESWKASDYWALTASPFMSNAARGPADRTDAPAAEHVDRFEHHDAPCSDLLDEGVRLAGAGDTADARRLFELAASSCPKSSGPWREMAGLHALAANWPAAAADARRALARESADAHAARILATALYLTDDSNGALDAWNRVGEPAIDLLNITGLERTRFAVAARAMGLERQTVLTRRNLTAAQRRIAEMPFAQATRIAFRPGETGHAQVDAAVIERPLFPHSAIAFGTLALHALTDREAAVTIASPSGGGEAWTASWRWWERRPKLAFGFEAPSPLGGIWGVSVFDERQEYADTRGVFAESQRRASFHISNWTVAGIRWEGSMALDRFSGADGTSSLRAAAASGSVGYRFLSERAFTEVRAGLWAGQVDSWTLAVGSDWRSSVRNEGRVVIARAVASLAASDAPLALWPGAGTGQGRGGLLRAHPLIDDGVIEDGVFGRHVINGGLEWRRWMQPARKPVRLGPAFFMDAARAFRGLDSSIERWQYDVGAGFRLAIPGSGVLRVDVAHGLRDGRSALSMGWTK